MNETIARLITNVPAKISTPIKTLCQVIAEMSSESEPNISNLDGRGFQRELSKASAATRQQSLWPDHRVAAGDFPRPARIRRGHDLRRVRAPAPPQADRSRQQPSPAA